MKAFCYYECRYIFETKESKGSAANGKKAKDAKSEKTSQQKVITRLQVGCSLVCIFKCVYVYWWYIGFDETQFLKFQMAYLKCFTKIFDTSWHKF